MQQQYRCPKCNAAVSYGAQSCNNCGQPFKWPEPQQPQQSYICPRCKQPIAYGIASCGHCQQTFKWPEQGQTQPPQQPSPAQQIQTLQYQQGYQQTYQPPQYQQQYNAEPTKKKMSSWLIGCLGLLGLAVIIGAVTLGVGTSRPEVETPPASVPRDSTSQPEVETPPASVPQDNTTRATDAPPVSEISLAITSITSPVDAGDDAMLVAKTAPGAQCTITVYYKSGPSTAAGLSPKQADSNGNVSWTWKVGSKTTPGSWRIVVKATYNGSAVSEETHFTVK